MLVLVTLSECLPKIWKRYNYQYMLVCSSEQVLRMLTDGPVTEREQNRYGMGWNGYRIDMKRIKNRNGNASRMATEHILSSVSCNK